MTILLVGLGNPGTIYDETRHNVGFRFIDKLITHYKLPNLTDKENFSFCSFSQNDQKIILLKPMQYMNLSGKAVGYIANFYKINAENILVFHDELALETGKIKVKSGGSAGGHNGLKSINDYIEPNYWHIKIGISRPDHNNVSNYVLSKPNLDDQIKIDYSLEKLIENANFLYRKDFNFIKKI